MDIDLDQTDNRKEKVINVVVIKQNDESYLIHPQDMLVSSNTHIPERQSIASPNVRDFALLNSFSSYQEKCTSSISHRNTSKSNPIYRPTNLHKSQSLCGQQPRDEVSFSCISSLTDRSVFNISSVTNNNISSSQAEQIENISTFSPQQSIIRISHSQTLGQIKKLSKVSSSNVSISHNRCDVLSPVYLVNSQGQSTSLVTTPDSGFCTPSSGVKDESCSWPAFGSCTPRSSREGSRDAWASLRETISLNKASKKAGHVEDAGNENESPLDKSLNCVQWLQAYSVEEPQELCASSQQLNRVSDLEKSSCHNRIAQYGPTANTRVFTVPSPDVTHSLSCSSVSSGSSQNAPASSNLQNWRVLQELDTNRFFGSTGVTEPKKAQYERPSYSYMGLIKIALKNSPEGQLTVKEILEWIEDQFPYFKYKAKRSWKSSVRCNLSMHPDFTKVEDKKRGGKWKVTDDSKSYIPRLPKPPVIKQPKVPAVTSLKPRRSGPLPILPRSVPYALVPLPMAAFEQRNPTQSLQQQALQILQNQHQFIQLPLQAQTQVNKIQQQLESLNTSRQQLSSPSPVSSSHQIKPRQLAPKLQPEHTSSPWDPKAFIVCGSEKNMSIKSTDTELVSRKCDIPQNGDNLRNSSFIISSENKGISPGPIDLQPVGFQIQPGNQSNEKKIVFYLKHHQDQNSLNKLTASETKDQRSQGNTGDSRMLKPNLTTPSKARNVCKSVDKIQRSKSFDVACRNEQIRPYGNGKGEQRERRVHVMNLQRLLTEDKENIKDAGTIHQTSSRTEAHKAEGKIQVLYNDDGGELMADLSSEARNVFKKNLSSRPDSAPSKCLIQQAWTEARFPNDSSKEHERGLLDRQAPSIPEIVNSRPITSTKLDKRSFSDTTSSFSPLCMGYQFSRQVVHPSPKAAANASSSTQLLEIEKKECRQINSRCNSTRAGNDSQEFVAQNTHKFDNNRTLSVNSDISQVSSTREWPHQENQISTYTTAANAPLKPMSASKIIFTRLSDSCQGFKSSTSPIVVRSTCTASLPSLTSSQPDFSLQSVPTQCISQPDFSLQSVPTQCISQPRFYRTKSRRKQIHTPMITDIAPDSATQLSEPSAIGLSEPSAIGLSEPSAIGLSEPSAIGLSEPSAIGLPSPSANRMSDPSAIRLSDPSAIRLSDPSAIRLSDPSAIRLSDPSAIRLSDPSAIRLSDPSAIRLSDPSAIRLPSPSAIRLPSPSANRLLSPCDIRLSEPSAIGLPSPSSNRMSDPSAIRLSEPSANRLLSPSDIRLLEASATKYGGPNNPALSFCLYADEKADTAGRSVFLTPSCGTDPSHRTASSPNPDNPSPLDFARFLSTFSSSPYKHPFVSNAGDKNIPLSPFPLPSHSSLPLTQQPFLLNPQSSSPPTSQSSTTCASGERMHVHDSPHSVSQENAFLSPHSALLSAAAITLTPTSTYVAADPQLYPGDSNFLISSSPPLSSSRCRKVNLSHSPSSATLSHFLSMTSTPPAGDLSISISSTPTRGMNLPLEMLHVPVNSGFLDSSLFDTLDSLMQNSLYEFKTP